MTAKNFLRNIAACVVAIIIVFCCFSAPAMAQNATALSIGQLLKWTEPNPCAVSGTAANCDPNFVPATGYWVPVFLGGHFDKSLTVVTLAYADNIGRLATRTKSMPIDLGATATSVLFITGNATPVAVIATTGMLGPVSDILTMSDPGNLGTLYYADKEKINDLMALSKVQNGWVYPVGTGVQVETSFHANDADSIGILATLVYEDGTMEERFVPRGEPITWLPTAKPVARANLFRIITDASTSVSLVSFQQRYFPLADGATDSAN